MDARTPAEPKISELSSSCFSPQCCQDSVPGFSRMACRWPPCLSFHPSHVSLQAITMHSDCIFKKEQAVCLEKIQRANHLLGFNDSSPGEPCGWVCCPQHMRPDSCSALQRVGRGHLSLGHPLGPWHPASTLGSDPGLALHGPVCLEWLDVTTFSPLGAGLGRCLSWSLLAGCLSLWQQGCSCQ